MTEADETGEGRTARLLAVGAMMAGGLLLVATALIHLHLHGHGYGSIPTIGTLFMLQAVAALVLAVAVAAWHRWFVAAAGALFLLSTAGGLLYSTWFGLFGFKEDLAAPYAGMSLAIELLGAALLGAAALVLLRLDRRAGRPLWGRRPVGVPQA